MKNKKNKNIMSKVKGSSEDRSTTTNILLCLFSLFGVLFIPALLQITFINMKMNSMLASMLSEIIFIIILVIIYYKDLKKEFNNFKNNFSSSFKIGFKYYLSGLLCMFTSNLLIVFLLNNISQNEQGVRDILFSSPFISFINIALLAPVAEELSFRKSLSTVFKNKYIYATISFLLFGLAHLATNFISGTFVLTDLLYLIPYGSLGFVFALMDYETKSTFTSITMHFLHNAGTCLLLLMVL